MQNSTPMKLPPLNSIKAFEATARLGGFSSAALELNVSAAAVSQQVRNAEDFFGKQLFSRTNNSIALTDAGRTLYPEAAKALNSLAAITGQLLENEARSRFVVSTIQALAERWVAPAIAAVREAHPDVGIELLIQDDPVDFALHRIDVRLTYGNQFYPQMQGVPVCQDRVLPLCSPRFAATYEHDISNVPDSDLIHIDWGEAYASYPTWAGWFRKAGFAHYPDIEQGIRVAGAAVGTALAERGTGIVLASEVLTQAQIRTGTLIPLHTGSLPLVYAFHAIVRGPAVTGGPPPHNQPYIDTLLQALENEGWPTEPYG